MNIGLALALFLLALALIVIGWRGTYARAWQMLTGRTTTFGKSTGSSSSEGSNAASQAQTIAAMSLNGGATPGGGLLGP